MPSHHDDAHCMTSAVQLTRFSDAAQAGGALGADRSTVAATPLVIGWPESDPIGRSLVHSTPIARSLVTGADGVVTISLSYVHPPPAGLADPACMAPSAAAGGEGGTGQACGSAGFRATVDGVASTPVTKPNQPQNQPNRGTCTRASAVQLTHRIFHRWCQAGMGFEAIALAPRVSGGGLVCQQVVADADFPRLVVQDEVSTTLLYIYKRV